MLQQRDDLSVVAEAADGAEAVQLTRDLKPDLVLLDIGLPKLNGLDAARQIRTLVPGTKLLFLSLEAFPDTVSEAFGLGGAGYVHKLRAQTDLLPAIEAVLAGTRFVGSDVAFIDRDSYARHEVCLYSHDGDLLDGVTHFLFAALATGNPAIVLATRSHSEALVQRLEEKGFHIEDAIRKGTYVPLDADTMLSRIMVNGAPDLDAFLKGLAGLIEAAALASKIQSPRVAIFGECVGLLSSQGNMEAAIQIERTGNELLKTRDVDILCAYPLNAFHPQRNDVALREICAQHTAVRSHCGDA